MASLLTASPGLPTLDFTKLHVIAVISNPIRYESRYRLFHEFKEDIERKGAQLWTIESQTGVRTPQVTDWGHPRHFQIWSTGLDGIMWSKEMLQNYLTRLMTAHCPDWRYVIYVDADTRYEKDWLERTAHKLQLHPVVQPWSHAVDFHPNGGAIGDKMQMSFAYCYTRGIEVQSQTGYTRGGHPGYSLAMRREAYNHLGGLIDIGILGSGDRHMLCGIIGKVEESYHPEVSAGYKRYLHQWQDRAEIYIKRNLGVVENLVRHSFHGNKKDRQYGSRWKILTKWKFDPYTDLKLDANGMWNLVVDSPRQRGLRDATYRYHESRLEDSNHV